MPFNNSVERWREWATWEAKDVPVDLLLAIVQAESDGKPGVKSAGPSNCADLPTDAGQVETICNDLGLCQISPQTAQFFNSHAPPPGLTLDDLTGSDERAVRQQLRAGAWYLAYCSAGLNQSYPQRFKAKSIADADDNQIKVALAAYGAGLGGTREKLAILSARRLPLTFVQLSASFPDWHGLKGANKKWSIYSANKSAPAIAQAGSKPGWIGPAVAIGAWFLLRQWRSAQPTRPAEPEPEPVELDNDEDDNTETEGA